MPIKHKQITKKKKKKNTTKTKKAIQKEKKLQLDLALNNNLPPPGPLANIKQLDKSKKPADRFKDVEEPINWGLGVEHEMHIFHKGKGGMKNTNIVFDSQESSCFLTGEKDPQGSCKKSRNGNNYYSPPKRILNMILKLNKTKLTKEEKEIIAYLDWEQSGKYIGTCEYPMVLPRIKVLMPEFVTGNFKNRTIDSITEELYYLEDTYLKMHMKNPIVKEKVEKYGKLTTHLCGSHNDIRVPIRPTIYSDTYQFDDPNLTKHKDYLGSYHITLTLPHRPSISKKEFINMHQNMANQIQWLEPLFIGAYFGPDLDSVGSYGNKRVKGAFRVMTTGWGTFAGSDVRTFGTRGVGRAPNIKTYWRDNLVFPTDEDELLDYCTRTAKPVYKGSDSVLGSDFRTFNFEHNMEKCQKLYTPYDCPKVDGGLMEPPYGVEIRIFDHFPKEYLLDLLRIIILIASNSKRHPPTKYVYKDKTWINTVQKCMKFGWNAQLSNAYINLLRQQLGLPIKLPIRTGKEDHETRSKSVLALDVLKQIVHELYLTNKESLYNQLLNEKPEEEPHLPDLNKQCWEMECNAKWMKTLTIILEKIKKDKKITAKKTRIPISVFRKYVFEHPKMGKKRWETDIPDILYMLETYKKVALVYDNYNITHFRILL